MSELYQYSKKKIEIKDKNNYDTFNNSGLKINTKFLLLKPNRKNEIHIYNLSNSSFFKLEFNNIKYYDFHNYFENIFFVCDGKDIMIYEINVNNEIINNISKVKGNFTDVEYADFNPSEHNIFVSISENYDIKIYDITKSVPISHIFIDRPLIYELIRWGNNNMGVLAGKTILTFSYKFFLKKNIKEFPFDDIISDFHFYNDNVLIVLQVKHILIVSKNEETIGKNIIYDLKSTLENNFYSKNNKKLILFCTDNIIILSIDNNFKVKEFYTIFLLLLDHHTILNKLMKNEIDAL